jgi:hypothetical protein
MIGNHSSGEAASHKLISISEAYKAAVTSAQKEDPLMDGKKQTVSVTSFLYNCVRFSIN